MSGSESEEQHYDLSGIGVRLRGLREGCGELLQEAWREYAIKESRPAFLDVRVSVGGSSTKSSHRSGRIESSFQGSNARFRLPEGEVHVGDNGRTEVLLAPGSDSGLFYGLLNLLLAALAWSLPSRGMIVLHASGIVLDGFAHVLVGPEGSGKTTWAELAKAAGASYLSDDVVFVDVSKAPVEVLSVPFRANHPRPLGPGHWPLPALLFAVHGETAALAPADRMQARGTLAANLPYVADRVEADPRIGRLIERLVDRVPLRTLTFAKDPSFLELLRELAQAAPE